MEQDQITVKTILFSTLRFYPTMLPVLGLVLTDAMNYCIQISVLYRLVPKSADQETNDLLTGLGIICFGVGCIVGGFLGGKLCDKFQLKKVASFGALLYGLCCLSILGASLAESSALALGIYGFAGFEFSFIEGCEFVICSRVFGGVAKSFAVVKHFQNVCVLAFQVVMLATAGSIGVEYMMMVLVLAVVPAWVGLRRLPDGAPEKFSLLETND